jgi:hypothetical protein
VIESRWTTAGKAGLVRARAALPLVLLDMLREWEDSPPQPLRSVNLTHYPL